MTIRAFLLMELVTLIVSLTGAPAPPPRVLAVLKELDRISARPLWPGFEPWQIPVAVFDGGRTWLARHPSPPEGFQPWPGDRRVRVFDGRHASLRANTAVSLAGIETATASFEGHAEGTRRLAGLLVHEMFHVFQARRHPKWGGNEVEQLIYPTEDAEVLALRRLPAWKRQLEEKDDAPLDELLRRAVAGVSPAEFSAAGEVRARERAAADVKALGERRAALRREFLEAGGWTVVLETFDPVFPQAFDPWNVERVSESEVLHTRWVKLGNSAGSVEVLDRKCLTEGAGKHPLFDGVRRATLTGLAAEPRLEETADGVRLATDGVNLDFRGARISRTGHTVTITVPRSPPSPTATPSSPGYSSDSDVPSPGSVGSASPIERADPSLRSG